MKPTAANRSFEQLVSVVYKGPAARVVDDNGTTYERGQPTIVSAADWQRLAASPMSEAFVKLAEPSNRPAVCGIPRLFRRAEGGCQSGPRSYLSQVVRNNRARSVSK